MEMVLADIECEGVERVYLAQVRVHWLAFVNTVMNFRAP
jgi:hypothetical protein